MKRVLVTGAAGFLGSHLTDALLARGYDVVGVDNLSHGNTGNLSQAQLSAAFTFHSLDVRDLNALREAAKNVDTIVHLAAFKIPRYRGALDTLLVNSEGTMNALKLAAELSARFVITSTSDVYGKNPHLPFSEEHDSVLGPPTVARWAYAASKLFDEHLVLAAAGEWGLNATIVRIFGSYGPRQNLSWWGGPQSVFIGAFLQGQTIPIHGDGLQTRSFTYVEDTVRGILMVTEASNIGGEIINIGSNREITILELANRIHDLIEPEGELQVVMQPYDEISGKRYEDVRRRVPDIEKAKRLLGFEATVPLEDGLAATIAWQRTAMLAQEAQAGQHDELPQDEGTLVPALSS
ncbi:MAG: NAD-dependent epimerase/dehydratase family protein [Acidobacteriaceae bacterium]